MTDTTTRIRTRSLFTGVAALACLLGVLAAGCGRGERAGVAGPASAGRQHPAGWVADHPAQALSSLQNCTQCHEMTVLRTGSAIPSCMTAECHHKPSPGWPTAGIHGAQAKRAPGPSGGGLASCQLCHGVDYKGGGSGVSCASCHGVQAPHPTKPWRGGSLTHATTDPSAAAACAQCHYPGAPANPADHPLNPAPKGTVPGCFNNTLCHGNAAAPHELGPVWLQPTSVAFHGLEAKKDLLACQACHGTPGTTKFDGGAAATACSSCHTDAKAHSKPWHAAPASGFPPYTPSHRNALKRETACAVCHDVEKGRTPPLVAAPSCYSAAQNGVGCHANGPGQANHPVPFLDSVHTSANQAAFDTNCGSCHAVTGASPLAAAPLCTACHQAASPLATANCASCHAKPPRGAAFPDVAGSHAKHDALPAAGQCTTCHQGTDAGSQAHYDHANGRPGSDGLRTAPGETGFLATYQAKAGPAAFNPANLTCSNISCHGGQAAPSWQGGRIDANSEAGCVACHTLGTAQGTPENNSPYSGLHALHMAAKAGAQCTECHAMGNGTSGALNHFKFLNTSQMEGPASTTVAPLGNPAYYVPLTQSCGTFTCHGEQHTNLSWIGGANHPVPFLDSAHLTARQASFDDNCRGCHADTGASPVPAAPTCSACHQAGSALTTTGCASCHHKPPTGAAFPDLAGKHGKHEALQGVSTVCSSCHSGADTGTLVHYDHANARPGHNALRTPPAPTSFLAAFNAKAGTATFNPASLTCASVSCHGGATAPSWSTGTLDSASEAGCRACHALGTAAGVPENNSLYSGLHALHLGSSANAQCVECHLMTGTSPGAQNHFTSLLTPQMEGPASSTVAPLGNPAYYVPLTQSCGSFTCHGAPHNGFTWTGGPNHPVPFTTAPHTAANQASFDADCRYCHAVTGVSPLPTAPTCAACHQATSPLTVSNCQSCHAKPPTGTAFPNIAGSHAKHEAFPGVTGACDTCHDASGTGTQTHYDHANGRPGHDALRTPPGEVKQLATYNAKNATAAFNPAALSCSAVSCHGGQATPNWQSGSIPSTTDAGCRACHVVGTAQGSPQYNSAWSGEHRKHNGGDVNALCTDCHAMANGTSGATNHYKFLATPAMEGPAGQTVAPQGVPSAYNQTAKTCTLTCHGENHQNERWN
jgi:predicted CxxxxCH...CXXCH cytochrome family protein